jgi:uncharacterized protein YjbI with pentapeptide repeats
MPNNTTSSNMGLIIPTVGSEAGPAWASDINASLNIIDQHSHAPGQGVPVTPSGINISSDLSFMGNNITSLKTVNFSNQSASLSGVSPNLGCAYVAGGELYYNDESGNVVKITASGSVNAGAGSITGLPSGTASASYSASTFIWQSATSTPASLDAGSIIIRNTTASAHGITLSPPNALAADYSVAFPAALPGSTLPVSLSAAGNLSAAQITTAQIGSSQVTTALIADSNVTTAKIADANVTKAKLAALGQIVSNADGSSHSTSTSASIASDVTIVSTGRPVFIGLFNDFAASNTAYIAAKTDGEIRILRDSVIICRMRIASGSSTSVFVPPSTFYLLDTGATAASHTYTIQAFVITGTIEWQNAGIIAYEID